MCCTCTQNNRAYVFWRNNKFLLLYSIICDTNYQPINRIKNLWLLCAELCHVPHSTHINGFPRRYFAKCWQSTDCGLLALQIQICIIFICGNTVRWSTCEQYTERQCSKRNCLYFKRAPLFVIKCCQHVWDLLKS